MNPCRVLAVALGVMNAGAPASGAAQVLATGGVYGGPTQQRAYCYFFNAGPTDVLVKRHTLINQDGSIVERNAGCGGRIYPPPTPLAPGETCYVQAETESGTAYACRIVIEGSKAKIRGTLDIRDVDDKVLTSSPLR